jgi:hypothetical protein
MDAAPLAPDVELRRSCCLAVVITLPLAAWAEIDAATCSERPSSMAA